MYKCEDSWTRRQPTYQRMKQRIRPVLSVVSRNCRALTQAVSRRPPTAKGRVPSRASPCGVCGGQSGTATGSSRDTSALPLAVPFHQ